MNRLEEIQQALQEYLLSGAPAIAGAIADGSDVPVQRRLEVYAHAYRQRLLEALTAAGAIGKSVAIEVPTSRVAADTASSLALIFHELATNAVKYGALSTADGYVELHGTEAAEGTRLTWVERGGPPVDLQPTRRGFGSRLLERSMKPEAGEVQVAFRPEGLTATIFLNKATS